MGHFQELAKLDDTKIIIGGQSPSLLFFLKDIKPMCQVLKVGDGGQLVDANLDDIGEFAYDNVIEVGTHTKKSVENWYKFWQLYKTYPDNNILFWGQVLEHNQEQAHKWLKEIGIDDPHNHPYIRHITSHSFAGNVPGRRTEYSDIDPRGYELCCYCDPDWTTRYQ